MAEAAAEECGIRATLYDAEGRDQAVELNATAFEGLGDAQLLWVDGCADDFTDDLPLPDAVKEAIEELRGEGPTIRMGEGLYWFTVPACPDRRTEAGALTSFIVCGTDALVTVRHSQVEAFDRFIETDRGETLKGRLSASSLAAAVMMAHLGDFQREIARIDDEVDELDDSILRKREKGDPLHRLSVLRRRLAKLRRALGGHRGVIHSLVRADFAPMIEDAEARHFEHLHALYERLEDEVARGRDAVVASFDIYATRVAQDTNELLRVLTIVTVALGIIGSIAGVFGMNFDIDFVPHSQQGFLIVLGAITAVTLGFLALSAWKRWL